MDHTPTPTPRAGCGDSVSEELQGAYRRGAFGKWVWGVGGVCTGAAEKGPEPGACKLLPGPAGSSPLKSVKQAFTEKKTGLVEGRQVPRLSKSVTGDRPGGRCPARALGAGGGPACDGRQLGAGAGA